MKLLAFAGASLCILAAPAYSMDCARASTRVEHQICSSKTLLKTDQEMSTTYSKLLRSISDPEIHAALIESQRRWIKAREEGINDPASADTADDDDGAKASWADVLTKVTQDRTNYLRKQTAGGSAFVNSALNQRKALGPSGKGPSAGYSTECMFIPDRQDPNSYTYNCFGSMSRQQDDRVCTETDDFASYSAETTRTVIDISGGAQHLRATCGIGYDGIKACPDNAIDPKAADGGWDMTASADQAKNSAAGAEKLKLDPESSISIEDADWMNACLKDKTFPAPSGSKQ